MARGLRGKPAGIGGVGKGNKSTPEVVESKRCDTEMAPCPIGQGTCSPTGGGKGVETLLHGGARCELE